MIYFDSSLFLSVYLSQSEADRARGIIASADAKSSSWLLAIEVPIVLRRSLGSQEETRLISALSSFDSVLEGMALVSNLPEIAARVRADPRFAQCRALDAIHVASALLLQEETGRTVRFATFDDDQRALATTSGLDVL
ncbi:MAG: PIN domain-containing protein [Deltaproteobacteria bacterium]|nr:PIN domain-containing protein [Deltaproteobacteria bacterium]